MKKISLLLFPTLFGFLLGSCTPNKAQPKKDFEDITWPDATYVYDAQRHILDTVKGAPEGTTITYTGREYYTNVGNYDATALLQKDGYNDLTLTATLNITKANLKNITFADKTFEYDGQPHTITCLNVPYYATVEYENNVGTEIGTYDATATITADNYNTLVLHATLTIIEPLLDFDDAYMENETVEYDGDYHTIAPKGIPEETNIEYNGSYMFKNAGKYTISCTVSKEGYHNKTLSAELLITPAKPSGSYYMNDESFLYDGNYHSIEVTTSGSYTITYKCLNHTGTNSFKDVGVYNIQAEVKSDANHIAYLTATLTIIGVSPSSMFGTDSSKAPLTIDENLDWDTLHDALKNDNFTVRSFSSSYDTDEEDVDMADYYENNSDPTYFACDGKEAVRYYYSSEYESYGFMFRQGDDYIDYKFYTNNYYPGTLTKAPVAAFSETVAKAWSSLALVSLTKGENGEFLMGSNGDEYIAHYNGDMGHCLIKDGKFIVINQHYRTASGGFSTGYQYRIFYAVYEFYNIGNTTITIPNILRSEMNVNDISCNDDYIIDGVQYGYHLVSTYNSPYVLMARTYLTYCEQIFLEKGVHYILPDVYGKPIVRVVHTYYSQHIFNYDMNGYELNVYFDKNGNYCGEYADYGTVVDKTGDFVKRGGVIHYYNEWATN